MLYAHVIDVPTCTALMSHHTDLHWPASSAAAATIHSLHWALFSAGQHCPAMLSLLLAHDMHKCTYKGV